VREFEGNLEFPEVQMNWKMSSLPAKTAV